MEGKSVLILMGSISDKPAVDEAMAVLDRFGVSYSAHVSSAHRTPDKTVELVKEADNSEDVKVILCAAGKAAHLAGVAAAHTTKPVLGLPMATSVAGGLDSLFSTVQMPKGTPVGTFGTGNAGAYNSAVFAVQIMALSDKSLLKKLLEYKEDIVSDVARQDQQLKEAIVSK